jgi:hypothetical protein
VSRQSCSSSRRGGQRPVVKRARLADTCRQDLPLLTTTMLSGTDITRCRRFPRLTAAVPEHPVEQSARAR